MDTLSDALVILLNGAPQTGKSPLIKIISEQSYQARLTHSG